jgi:hypothetical protein
MTTKVKAVFYLALIGCIASLAIAPTGLIAREVLQLADWWQSGSYRWGFGISVVAFSLSATSIIVAVWFSRTNRILRQKLHEILAELREQRRAIESLDANFGRILDICADNRAAMSVVDERISALTEAVSMTDEVEEKTIRSRFSAC